MMMRAHNIQKVVGLGTIVVLVGILAGALYAQSQPGPMPQGPPMGMPGRMGPGGPMGQGPRTGMPGGMGFGGPMGHLMVWGLIAGPLNVTPDQQQGIRQLVQNSNLPQLARGVATAQQDLAGAIITGQDATSATKELAAAEGELTAMEVQIVSQIFQNVLTEAQRDQAKQLWSQRQQRQGRPQPQGGQ
jgi:hypothetical protein